MSKTLARQDRSPTGRFTWDDRGNAVWKANVEVRTEDTLMRVLKPEELSLLLEAAEGKSIYDRSGVRDKSR